MTTDRRAFAELVQHLHDKTGLSWKQLAKLFGVGFRAVQGWTLGHPVTSHHKAMVSALAEQVAELTGTPDEVKAAMFAPRSGGTNLYTDFIRARIAAQGPDINPTIGLWWKPDAALARRDEETR